MFKIFSTLHYHIVHSPVYIMQIKNMKMEFRIQYLTYIPNLVLMVAIILGLYTQWMSTQKTSVIVIAFLGLFLFSTVLALQYYFSFQNISEILLYIWVGCLLGILMFSEQVDQTAQQVTNALFILSSGLRWILNIVDRLKQLTKYEIKLFDNVCLLESFGLAIASLVTGGVESVSISLLIVAFVINLVAIRFKSFLSLLSFITFSLAASIIFFPLIKVPVNPYCLACFVCRHAFEPIIDLYFPRFFSLDRWKAFLNQSKVVRHLTVIGIFFMNLASGTVIGRLSFTHKEWFVVVPIFFVVAVIWMCFHVIFFITTWKLMKLFTECNSHFQTLSADRQNMNRIMASKGVRYFSLISQRFICLALLTTIIQAAIGWETQTGYSISLILIILPIETMTLSLFWELAANVGGTCTGYSLIAPAAAQRPLGSATLLTPGSIQEINASATNILNQMQKFFTFHMIDNYGCDFTMSGMAMEYVELKIKAFFERQTPDGIRHDTYILYYSGDVYEYGDWAMADNKKLTLGSILEWWALKNSDSGSRLILIIDSLRSYNWAKKIKRINNDYVAIQTCYYSNPTSPEDGLLSGVGQFTQDWTLYNLEADLNQSWQSKDRVVRAVLEVSRSWTDFSFHLPTEQDIEEHWNRHFPRCTKPLIKVIAYLQFGNLCCCCECLTRCIRRKRMRWMPPREIDTGHGFKLIRS